MTDEVHVTTSQADAAKLIVDRNSANGKATPEAIRKIAEAQAEPVPEATGAQQPVSVVSGSRRGWRGRFLARLSRTTDRSGN